VVPSVFSPTGWVRRKLTGKEMCRVNDVPDKVYETLGPREVAAICESVIYPVSVAVAVLEAWMKLEGSESQAAARDAKRMCKERDDIVSRSSTNPPLRIGERESERKAKSVKSDDAAVPEYLWNMRLVPDEDPEKVDKLRRLRKFAFQWCKRNLWREFLQWFYTKYEGFPRHLGNQTMEGYHQWRAEIQVALTASRECMRDWEAGRECVSRYCNSGWWEWHDGSRPHFWRWPHEYQQAIRDGVTPWFRHITPTWQVPQRPENDIRVKAAMKEKLEKIRRLKYIQVGPMVSLTSYFAVPKGKDDIRMVYDGTKNGLNDSLWAPWFSLPTVKMHLRFVGGEVVHGQYRHWGHVPQLSPA
jgi:hypothetical protein